MASKFWSTLSFSALVATITIFSVMNQLGMASSDIYVRVFMHHRPSSNAEMAAYMQSITILIGAWLGAVVIPLDWERPWQQWPVSCVLGALLGQAVGAVGTIVLLLMPAVVEDKDKDE
ncbi:Glycosylphosphatidylinositol (GPI) anchor assembly protein [Umbelopsis nana]